MNIFWEDVLCFVGLAVFFVLIAVVISVAIGLPAALTDCKLYNERFGTHYTAWQFYWSRDTIISFINQGKQETYNINVKEVK